MINPIAPHNPPVQDSPGKSLTGGGRRQKDDTEFADLLPGSPAKAAPSPIKDHSPPKVDEPATDDASEPTLHRPGRWKGGKGPATESSGPDASTGVPLLPAQVDLRSMVAAITLSPQWTPPVVAPEDSEGTPRNSGPIPDAPAADVAMVGSAGNPTAETAPAPASPMLTADTMAIPNASKAVLPAEGTPDPLPGVLTPVPGPSAGTVQGATDRPGTDDSEKPLSSNDSRAVDTTLKVESSVEVSLPPSNDEAKIAGPALRDVRTAHGSKNFDAQVTESQALNTGKEVDGMTVAKDEVVVTTTLPTSERETAASPSPKRGGVSTDTVAPGRLTITNALDRDGSIGIPVTGVSGPGAPTPQSVGTAATDPTAARQVVKVETLLQNALRGGESLRPNGQDQMELRVRLGGGTEDVTVRMQVANDRMQVTFQTTSPELRKALEHGWEQFFRCRSADLDARAVRTPFRDGTLQCGGPRRSSRRAIIFLGSAKFPPPRCRASVRGGRRFVWCNAACRKRHDFHRCNRH